MPSGAEYEGAGAKVKVPNGTDWFDELFEQAEVTDIAVSASGGSEQGRYPLSANYQTAGGAGTANQGYGGGGGHATGAG